MHVHVFEISHMHVLQIDMHLSHLAFIQTFASDAIIWEKYLLLSYHMLYLTIFLIMFMRNRRYQRKLLHVLLACIANYRYTRMYESGQYYNYLENYVHPGPLATYLCIYNMYICI